jgi:uncharacterized SAM-binding protein YcdF (DUF218 family)
LRISRRAGFAAIFCGALILLFLLAHEALFRNLGYFLIDAQDPVRSDAVVVLAGGWRGERILKGGELIRDGYAPKVLVSGPFSLYGVNEADLAISFAARNGFDRGLFEPVYAGAYSTRDEAEQFAPRLRARGIRSILLVTANYHTRRAGAVFRRQLGNDVSVRVVAAQDLFFNPESWWRDREGQKIVFYEVSKTLADWIGL